MEERAMKKRKRGKTPVVFHAGIAIREIRPDYFMVDMMRDGKRERLCFNDIEVAKTHCDIMARKILNEGTSALDMSPAQRTDAAKAIEALNNKTTLYNAVKFWLIHNGGAEGVTLQELGDRFMKAITGAGCRATTIRERKHKIGRLSQTLGKTPVRAITKEMLIQWLDDVHVEGVTRDGYRRCFRTMFQLGIDEKIMEHNPAAEIKAIKCDEKLPTPFSVQDVTTIMATAESVAPIMVPTLAVQFFAGLRPGEAKGLKWENINFDEKFIRVQPETSKVRAARIADINDTLMAWLLPYRKTSGPIGITTQNQFDFYMKKKQVVLEDGKKDGIIAAAGVTWIQDGPRKTFATMHFAINQDAGKLAAILGHVNGTDVLYKHYRGLTTRKEAEKYWKIYPAHEMGKVIQLKTA